MVTRAAEISKAWYDKNKEYHALRARKYLLQRRAWYKDQKIQRGPCIDCGVSFEPHIMDFDHRPGEEKLFQPGMCANPRIVTMAKAVAELAKCDLICANCHRQRTHDRGYFAAKEDAEFMELWATRTPARPRKS